MAAWWMLIIAGAMVRLATLPNKVAFLGWLGFIGCYALLRRVHHRYCENPAQDSLVTDILSRPVEFDVRAYVKVCMLVLMTWLVFRMVLGFPGMMRLCESLSVLICLAMILLGMLVPLVSLILILWELRRKGEASP